MVSVAALFLAVPALSGVPARLARGCGNWIAIAGMMELLSAVGFVVLFKLVFAASLGWRRSILVALRALFASTVLPAGGLIGPALGAWPGAAKRPSLSRMSRSTTTFVILTNTPGAIMLAAVGTLLWVGRPGGPHHAVLTLVPAMIAIVVLAATWLFGHSARHEASRVGRRPCTRRYAEPLRALGDGVGDARALISAGNWKLYGALAAYAFDNAVLWAAFHAFGHTPPLEVVVMGYVVGSLAGAVPLPAGLGAVDGGLIGALVLYGAPAGPAAAAVLLYRGISLLVPVVLGIVGWTCSPTGLRAPRLIGASGRAAPELAAAQIDGS